ncbi:hypothetical protein LTR36_002161 [Oleoguttula mirabilis]|uniref:F-box domain-containing protein n=1 Tax=Oleoguttula mirabilis TaxID=1507867 RepID=A0AAV9JLV5_9PEZI|nr:hypothetical protein LTR36_002161 [Oleoguttula mirabilis]
MISTALPVPKSLSPKDCTEAPCAPRTSTTQAQPCFFFELPQEIQDMIFALAYPKASPSCTRIVSRFDLESSWRHRKRAGWPLRSDHTIRLFTRKVEIFLISKAWFIGAAKAYMCAQVWSFEDKALRLVGEHPGLFVQFATTLKVYKASQLLHFAKWQGVKVLVVCVSRKAFEEMSTKEMWLDLCEEADFDKLSITAALKSLTSLEHLDFLLSACYYAIAGSERDTLRRNIEALKGHVLRSVSAERGNSRKAGMTEERLTGRTPLYAGSRVWFEGAEDHADGLKDSDIPESKGGLLRLINERAPDLLTWIRAKRA